MSGRRSRQKGARGERLVASVLKRAFPDVRRGRQYDSARECDVEGTPFRLEVKLRKTIPYGLIEQALEQAKNDGHGFDDPRVPLAITKRDRGPFIFHGYLEDLVRIAETLFYKNDEDTKTNLQVLFGEDAYGED